MHLKHISQERIRSNAVDSKEVSVFHKISTNPLEGKFTIYGINTMLSMLVTKMSAAERSQKFFLQRDDALT